jgi:hypothetical protein
MRPTRYVFPLLTGLLVACGGTIADVPSQGAPHGASGDGMGSGAAAGAGGGSAAGTGTVMVTGPATIVGVVSALTELANGQTSQRFDLNLQVMPPPPNGCATATSTVGSCCYFAPTPRPPTQVFGGGGTPAPETSAGTVTLTDVTSNVRIGSFDYASGVYAHAPAIYQSQVWRPGDALSVSATGAEIGAFTVSAPGLAPPSVQVPSPIVRAHDVTITWQPDTNAETFTFSVSNGVGATVACLVPDAAGTVTIDASLFEGFESSARLQALGMREAVRYAQTPTGRVAFKTFGWAPFDASID